MAQKLKFGNGTFATKKGSTLAYNDENNNYKPLPFTTTRNSIATRVNKEGLIEVVSNDVPRIDYTDSADGVLLLEPQRTNLLTHSNDFSQSEWNKQQSGTASVPIVTSNYAISPDGTQNADRVQLNLNGGTSGSDISFIGDYLTTISSATSGSFYLKSLDGIKNVRIRNGNAILNVDVTTQWTRFVVTDETSSNKLQVMLYGNSNSQSADLLIYGAQIEQGSYATSYIPTSGSTVQRAADTASGAGNSAVFNSEQGVLFANILPSTFTDVAPNFYKFISLSDGTPTNRLLLGITSSSKLSITMVTSGGNTAFTEKTISQQNLKVAINWDANYLTAYLNGFQYSTPLSVVSNFAANSLKSLNFNTPTSYPFYGKTKEIGYYDTALTDLELEYMTSYRTLNELVTELNLNTL